MSNRFLNSYHFVPLASGASQPAPTTRQPLKPGGKGTASPFGLDEGTSRLGHAIYAGNTHSGRIRCRLELKSPMVIGGKREAGQRGNPGRYAIVHPVMFRNRPIIPATSLKGLISSVLESASASALRVLPDRTLSFRKPATRALSAMGRLVKQGDGWLLEPLCAPMIVMTQHRTDGNWEFDTKDKNIEAWSRIFDSFAGYRSYIGKYKLIDKYINNDLFRNEYLKHVTNYNECFLPVQSKFGSLADLIDVMRSDVHNRFRLRQGRDQDYYLEIHTQELPRAEPDLNASPVWTKGLIRALGSPHADDQELPSTKKHELFIPIPEEGQGNTPLSVPSEVIAAFTALANQRARAENADASVKKRVPYMPLDLPADHSEAWTEERLKNGNRTFLPELRDGQIVYFDIAGINGDVVVSEISMSAIWRDAPRRNGSLEMATLHDFIKAHDGGNEMLPMSRSRKTISAAEMMFGFVQSDGPDTGRTNDDPPAERITALAGRVRFGNGMLGDDSNPFREETDVDPSDDRIPTANQNGYVRLKELSEPKPPSTSLYFTTRNGARVERTASSLSPDKAFVQGRKFYLHHDQDMTKPTREPWRTRKAVEADTDGRDRKAMARPVSRGTEFTFDVDFDNLSQEELELLCFSLKPSGHFWHKLGMGKAIGLGSVEIHVEAVQLIDRKARYEADPFAESWSRYAAQPIPDLNPASLANSARQRLKEIAPDAIQALLAIGEHHEGAPGWSPEPPVIQTPLTQAKLEALKASDWSRQAAAQDETYKWFVENDGSKVSKQHLKPIARSGLMGAALRTGGANTDGRRDYASPNRSAAVSTPRAEARVQTSGLSGEPPATRGSRSGTVKKFDNDKKFGFIRCGNGGPDVFVHISEVTKAGLRELGPGMKLSYDIGKNPKDGRPCAINLRLLP